MSTRTKLVRGLTQLKSSLISFICENPNKVRTLPENMIPSDLLFSVLRRVNFKI